MNWDTYLFHCSSLPALMTKPRTKGEVLSETAKSKLDEIWIEHTYGRRKELSNKYVEKGNLVEQDSLDLATKVLDMKFLAKNDKLFKNKFICGTPDAVDPIVDTKSSWDIWTFASIDEAKAIKSYGWQIWGYMWLLKVLKGYLVYCLVDTPSHILEHELYKMSFGMSDEEVEKKRVNYLFQDIPEKERVKSYILDFDSTKIEDVETTLTHCREYLKGMKL